MRGLVNALGALVAGGAGGALFSLIGAPLPWTLGSLAAAALISVAGWRWIMPGQVRELARPVVGILAGSAFTPEVVASIGEWWGAIVFVAIYSVTVSAVGWLFFRRLCGLDPVTSYFAATPGGLAEMSLLGGSMGGKMRTLVTIHAVRVVTVVFMMPFIVQFIAGGGMSPSGLPDGGGPPPVAFDWLVLAACGVAGYVAARVLRIPGGAMIGAMLFSAAAHGSGLTHAMPPGWSIAFVQVVIGSAVGARFAGIGWQEFRATALQAFTWVIVLLSTAAGIAWLGSMFFDRPFAALVLATAPGGMAEMTLISYALGIETAFVITCQVCRSGFVVLFGPLLFKLFGITPPHAGGSSGAAGPGP